MANEKHLYLVVGGGYANAEEQPEIWQFGVRLALVFGAVDDHGSLPNNWDVTDDEGSSTTGDYDNVWTFGVNGPLTFTFDPVSWMADYAQPSADAFINTGTFSQDAVLKYLKLSPISNTGHVIEGRTVVSTRSSAISGTASGAVLPLQCAVVVSERTPLIGRRGKGRIYLPAPVASVMDSHGRLGSSWVGDVLSNATAFFEGLSYTPESTEGPHVRPIVTGSPWVNYGMVQTLKVGDLVDTQRRRRNQIDETYVTGSLSYG